MSAAEEVLALDQLVPADEPYNTVIGCLAMREAVNGVRNVPAPVAVPSPKRIALIGSAPSSVGLAPYGDPSWAIWGCSPGAATVVPRIDAWFEIHDLADKQVVTPDYLAWLKLMGTAGKPVYVIEATPDIPNSVTYPLPDMREQFGDFFWTNSLAYMLALAITRNPEEIGLWGVDMAASSEYAYQKPACLFFVHLARERGIKITTPAESDLLRPPPRYGYSTVSHIGQKLAVRRKELQARQDALQVQYENVVREQMFIKGAIDDLEYVMNTWVD